MRLISKISLTQDTSWINVYRHHLRYRKPVHLHRTLGFGGCNIAHPEHLVHYDVVDRVCDDLEFIRTFNKVGIPQVVKNYTVKESFMATCSLMEW
jgi:hypothetical protein